MRILLFVCFLSIYTSLLQAQDQVSFYVQAHADDWQLFMSKNIVEDMKFAKIVIITVTAGDAGHGNTAYDKGKIPYYQAREKGAIYSSKFAFDLLEKEVNDIPSCTMVPINGHSIARYNYKDRMVNYFLRLPDGFHSGEGAASTGNQSIKKLRDGNIKSLTSVDNSTTYEGWSDLKETIKSIILAEKGSDEQVWINTPSSDPNYNTDDHSDHYTSSLLVQDAVNNMPWVGIVSWMHYRTRKLEANLTSSELENTTAIFAAYCWAIIESGYVTSFNDAHKRFLPGEYFKVTKRPTGSSISQKIDGMIQVVKRKIIP